MALSQWCKRATHVWPAPSWLCSVQWMLLELRASALCIGPWSCLGYLCNTGLIGMLVSGRHMPSQSLFAVREHLPLSELQVGKGSRTGGMQLWLSLA